ncbi:MAG: DEAD/DEAH box helicase [Nitrospira sp. NTP1]|nr:DEAD/DEAH box helicase [Nitrospira sp. NTP1]
MRPEQSSRVLLAITRSKAKMFEYGLPENEHIKIPRDPARLLRLAVGMLGDVAAAVSRNGTDAARIAEISSSLQFSARYFDAYAASGLAEAGDAHLLVLASATYYLCDLPGSSNVLVSRIVDVPNLDAGGLEHLLWWLLRGDFASAIEQTESPKYRDGIRSVSNGLKAFYDLDPQDERQPLGSALSLREAAYRDGTARELLFADACCAIVSRRIENSARRSLPQYSGLPLEAWKPALAKRSFVRELWPAQRLLGQRSIFAGGSAVVQMPTSAGKSRATELVIRSAFLSGRASLAVVVGPFRALCQEIRESLARAFRGEDVSVNELSDVFQRDFDFDELVAGRAILVMTPEKLVYVLRHLPELADRVGVLMLDEGHQFDTGPRGVTYELLVTSLKGMIPAVAQKVLISAVISNASDIAKWLTDDEGAVVAGADLLPTERTVAFASWKTQLGQLHFVAPENPDEDEFFVPRVIKSTSLALRPRETKERWFPEKGNGQSVALYLGLSLVRNGAIAIFCGRKDMATGLCEALIDVAARGLAMPMPVEVSDAHEVDRLASLYERNLGAGAAAARVAKIGAFTHHGNTPHGVRLAVEYAIKEGFGKFVLCTSTLAQGVNLPIRYLIVTTAQQGSEKIKVREFHNLMGRAGRSGMHTEGSVLFANPEVYDTRGVAESKWAEFKALLQLRNSEPCASTLLSALGALKSDGGQLTLAIDPLDVVRDYVADQDGSGAWVDEAATRLTRKWFATETLRRQLMERRDILVAVESFLMAHWKEGGDGEGFGAGPVGELAKRTLAYHLGSAEQRAQLLQLFELLAVNIVARAGDAERRRVYGRTLFGVGDTVGLEKWVADNLERIAGCADVDALFDVVWPCIAARIESDTFQKWRPVETREIFAKRWIAGDSFGFLHDSMTASGVRVGLGARPRRPKVELIVDMGENALGFAGAHVLGAIAELFELLISENGSADEPLRMIQILQKRLKYGLPAGAPILLYEVGFADRPLALELAVAFPYISSRSEMRDAMREGQTAVEAILARYPRYFTELFKQMVR